MKWSCCERGGLKVHLWLSTMPWCFIGGRECNAPGIFNLSTRWMWVVRYKTKQLVLTEYKVRWVPGPKFSTWGGKKYSVIVANWTLTRNHFVYRIMMNCVLAKANFGLIWEFHYRNAFSSVVRQMPGKTPQRRGTARILRTCCVALCIFCVVLCIFVFYVLFVLWRSLYCLCVYVYWTTATGWLPNRS